MAGGRVQEMVADFTAPVPLAQRSVVPEGLGISEEGYVFSMPTTKRDAATTVRPLPSVCTADAHLHSLTHRGYTVLPSVIPPQLLQQLQSSFDALIERVKRGECQNGASDAAGIIEVARVYEEQPIFEALMDLPAVHALVNAAMGAGQPRLLGGPFAHYVPPRTGSDMAWHRDGDILHGEWLRLTYTLDDLERSGGGTGLMPGSHTWRPGHSVPEWANDSHSGAAFDLPGTDEFFAPAGSCMLSWTSVWHCRLPNQSDRPRKLFWQL